MWVVGSAIKPKTVTTGEVRTRLSTPGMPRYHLTPPGEALLHLARTMEKIEETRANVRAAASGLTASHSAIFPNEKSRFVWAPIATA